MGLFPKSTSGLGMLKVSGLNLVPNPPTRIRAFNYEIWNLEGDVFWNYKSEITYGLGRTLFPGRRDNAAKTVIRTIIREIQRNIQNFIINQKLIVSFKCH